MNARETDGIDIEQKRKSRGTVAGRVVLTNRHFRVGIAAVSACMFACDSTVGWAHLPVRSDETRTGKCAHPTGTRMLEAKGSGLIDLADRHFRG